MNERIPSDSDELERLRLENEGLRRRLEFFKFEHRWAGRFATLVLLGPRLTASIQRWLTRASLTNPLPVEETTTLAAAIVRRLLAVGLLGLLIPTIPLVWQNLLIRDQNRYFREQTGELRKQIAIQEEQGDLIRRKDLLQAVYEGRALGFSMRTRVEALKALVTLDNKLIEQGKLEGSLVNARGIDFSCDGKEQRECADFGRAWLIRTDFSGSNFTGASFAQADLRGSSLVSANLSDTDLSLANIEGTVFRESAHEFIARLGEEQLYPPEDLHILQVYKLAGSLDFVIERTRLSEPTRELINDRTMAATINAKTRATLVKHLGAADSPNFISTATLLPLGLLPAQGLDEIKASYSILQTLGAFQAHANTLFGHYVADIDLKFLPGLEGPWGLTCQRRNQLEGAKAYYRPIDYLSFNRLSPTKQESILRGICGLPG